MDFWRTNPDVISICDSIFLLSLSLHQAAAEKEPIDRRVLKKLDELAKTGINSSSKLQTLLFQHVESEIFRGTSAPPKTRRRYFPTVKDIQNYMTRWNRKHKGLVAKGSVGTTTEEQNSAAPQLWSNDMGCEEVEDEVEVEGSVEEDGMADQGEEVQMIEERVVHDQIGQITMQTQAQHDALMSLMNTVVLNSVQQQVTMATDLGQRVAMANNFNQQISMETNSGQQLAMTTNSNQQVTMATDLGQRVAMANNCNQQIAMENNSGQPVIMATDSGQQVAMTSYPDQQAVMTTTATTLPTSSSEIPCVSSSSSSTSSQFIFSVVEQPASTPQSRDEDRLGLVQKMKQVMDQILESSQQVQDEGLLERFLVDLERMRSEASLNARMDPARGGTHSQEMAAVSLDPVPGSQEMAARLDPARGLRDIASSLDPARGLQENSAASLDPASGVQEMAARLDHVRGLPEIASSLDPARGSQDTSTTNLDPVRGTQETIAASVDPASGAHEKVASLAHGKVL